MTPAEMVERAKNEGVFLSANGAEKLKIAGTQNAVEKWLPALKKIKADIIRFLAEDPTRQDINQTTTGKTDSWIDEHSDELRKAGFTDRDICGHEWFTGLAGLKLWQIENLVVELRKDRLCFSWHNGHQTIKQSCQPERWRK